MLHSCLTFSFSAEPATVLYLLTGAASLVFARIRRFRRSSPESKPSTLMLLCQRSSRAALEKLHLL